jgi:Na+(H+)/acetate symporter ActP
VIVALAVAAVTVASLLVGSVGIRHARTPANFLVASRAVRPRWNAAAVCGDTLSAASYLGLAGLVLAFGIDMVWFPVGWAAAFVIMALFVVAPLRRFGAYTVPEFLEDRLDDRRIGRAVACVIPVIAMVYLLAQLKGAGVVVEVLTGAPYWVGVVAVVVIVVANVLAGGMRSVTTAQGFQFVLIAVGVLLPLAVLLAVWLSAPRPAQAEGPPVFAEATTVEYEARTTVVLDGDVTARVSGTVDGEVHDSRVGLAAGEREIGAGTTVTWPGGSPVPHAAALTPVTGADWGELGDAGEPPGGRSTYVAYSLLVASAVGLAGLPHILVRFTTNVSGVDTRRTAAIVLGFVAVYYSALPVYGALGRHVAPDLLSTGATDSVMLVVPDRVVGSTAGDVLVAVLAGGAVAAFLSTASGLVVAGASALSHDLVGGGIRWFPHATIAGGVVAVPLGLLVESVDISILVGWSTAIAASSLTPVLLLGLWWRGLTRAGALASIVVGGSAAGLAVLASVTGLAGRHSAWADTVLAAPAAWSVPLAFAVAVLVSRADRRPVPGVDRMFARMHLPDGPA